MTCICSSKVIWGFFKKKKFKILVKFWELFNKENTIWLVNFFTNRISEKVLYRPNPNQKLMVNFNSHNNLCGVLLMYFNVWMVQNDNYVYIQARSRIFWKGVSWDKGASVWRLQQLQKIWIMSCWSLTCVNFWFFFQ